MSERAAVPGFARRAAALGAIVLVVGVVVISSLRIVDDLRRLTVHVPLLIVAIGAAWFALTRTGGRRRIAGVVCVVALVGFLAFAAVEGWAVFGLAVARLAMLVAAAWLGRYALRRDTRTMQATPTSGTPISAASQPVLIVNPRSGDGKAERTGLVAACEERDIGVVMLEPGSDLRSLASAAIDLGADAIGMAGGDGSQAIVASVAAERNVPLVVVPAGTRNHLALDLGLDRNDVVGALDAFGDAVERRIDLAEVNGQAFVNNVSLGLYAEIVRSPAYRDAKVDTALSAIPSMLGPDADPFPLSFTDGNGGSHDTAHVIQVSNGPYGDTVDGRTTRPRLDGGTLGVTALELLGDKAARSFVTAAASGHPERYRGFASWATPVFRVDSPAPIAAGIDGEAVTLETPLLFETRPSAVRVRLPLHAIGASPAGRSLKAGDAFRGLFRVAVGRPPQGEEART